MSRAVTYILLIGLGFLFLIPFLWTVSTALKDNQDSFQFPPQWIPNPPLWENFAKAWTALPFTQWVLNTLFITVVTTIAGLLSGIAAVRATTSGLCSASLMSASVNAAV